LNKLCTGCGATYPRDAENFHRNKISKDGLGCYCKSCQNAHNRASQAKHSQANRVRKSAYRNRPEVRERERERLRNQRAKDPTRANARVKKCYYAHQEARLASRREYGKKNREQCSAYAKKWHIEHPLLTKAATARKRARKYGVQIDNLDLGLVLVRDRGLCHICGQATAPQTLTFDHVIPLCSGGPHSYDNVKVAHYECNRRKNKKEIAHESGVL
jgi:5-methylcytosine-specific restriction endonuclease McrA